MNYEKISKIINNLGGILSVNPACGNLIKVKIKFPDMSEGKNEWINYFYKNGQVSEFEAVANTLRVYANDTGQYSLMDPAPRRLRK